MDITEKSFRKLGYFKVTDEYFIYFKRYSSLGFSDVIEFDLVNRTFCKYTDDGYEVTPSDISIKELKVIYEFCSKLGWK